jgi:hypothetical protein
MSIQSNLFLRSVFSSAVVLALAPACDLGFPDMGDGGGTEGDDDDDDDDDGGDDNDDGRTTGGADDGEEGGSAPADSSAVDESGGNADSTGGSVEPGEIPEGLLGFWIGPTSDGAMGYQLEPDGTYLLVIYYEADDNGCFTTVEVDVVGTFTVQDDVLDFSEGEGIQFVDACGEYSEEPFAAGAQSWTWVLGEDAEGESLTLDDGQGSIVLHRAPDGGGEGGEGGA